MKEAEKVKRAKAVVKRRCFSFAAQLAELLKLDPAALIPGARDRAQSLQPEGPEGRGAQFGRRAACTVLYRAKSRPFFLFRHGARERRALLCRIQRPIF